MVFFFDLAHVCVTNTGAQLHNHLSGTSNCKLYLNRLSRYAVIKIILAYDLVRAWSVLLRLSECLLTNSKLIYSAQNNCAKSRSWYYIFSLSRLVLYRELRFVLLDWNSIKQSSVCFYLFGFVKIHLGIQAQFLSGIT